MHECMCVCVCVCVCAILPQLFLSEAYYYENTKMTNTENAGCFHVEK